MKLDIHTAVITLVALLSVLAAYGIWAGLRSIRKARKLKFFRMRRDRMVSGWRLLFLAFVFIISALLIRRFAEPIAYNFFPPTTTPADTPTITFTPTISLTPTITLSPTITPTPSVSDTPTITPTPHMPLAIEDLFTSTVTPGPESVFSPLQFARELDENFLPIEPAIVFQNPVGHLYAQFSYDRMTPGAQWTALWYYDGELVYYETSPWDGGTGGIGYSDWNPEPYMWYVGEYEVQIFAGVTWKTSGRFTVEGEPPTAVPSLTPTPTRTSTGTRAPSQTVSPSATRMPSQTATPRPTFLTSTPSFTYTNAPTFTQTPVTPPATHAPTSTNTRTLTPTPTRTRTPTPAR